MVELLESLDGVPFVSPAQIGEFGFGQLAAVSLLLEIEDPGERDALPFFGRALRHRLLEPASELSDGSDDVRDRHHRQHADDDGRRHGVLSRSAASSRSTRARSASSRAGTSR